MVPHYLQRSLPVPFMENIRPILLDFCMTLENTVLISNNAFMEGRQWTIPQQV